MADSSETSGQTEKLQAQLDRWGFVAAPFDPPPEAHVSQFEAELGQHLPADFRWFSLTYGRGYFQGVLDGPGTGLGVELQDGTVEYFNKIGMRSEWWRPPHYWPPGEVPGLVRCSASGFYFRLDGAHGESVWYSGETDYLIGSLVRAADSFTDLVAMATPARWNT